jgi:hypothetical protein
METNNAETIENWKVKYAVFSVLLGIPPVTAILLGTTLRTFPYTTEKKRVTLM